MIADFTVGREIGMGSWMDGGSMVSAGLRYAQFESSTVMDMYGLVDWYAKAIDEGGKYGARHWRYDAEVTADRDFKGVGPVITWEAAQRLLGDGHSGHLNIDWSVSAGTLFGKQKTSVTGEETAAYFIQPGLVFENTALPVDGPVTSPLDLVPRSKSVTVPTLGASLGLSYNVDRFSIGAGYRWERYYDAIDGGVTEREQHDRTIDGPYFKISVGFGGG